MSELTPKFLVLSSSKLSLPAISVLKNEKYAVEVVCYTRQAEIEDELALNCKSMEIPFTVLTKDKWETQLKEILHSTTPDAVLVKTFSFKIPEYLLKIPRLGFINFHYALLPQYRGAYPLFELMKNKEKYGGVTVHHMNSDFDKGDLIMQQYVPVEENETTAMHEYNLSWEAATLTKQLAEMLSDENCVLPAIPQSEADAVYYKKPQLKDLYLDWTVQTADEIIALVLASNAWSKGAISCWNNKPVSILYARKGPELTSFYMPGQIITIDETKGMRVACINNESVFVDVVHMPNGYIPGFMLYKWGLGIGHIAQKLS